eukprot:Ihof_evm2s15 gene=Ihof_evmTU2s15
MVFNSEALVRATLILEDGTRYEGYSFGAQRSVAGEAVFQTGMVGYPEGITDPSYEGQILTLTFPLLGNYGVPGTDIDYNGLPKLFESNRIHIAALVCQDYSFHYSHWAAVQSLSQWLVKENVPAIFGVDTRALTMRLRQKGSTLAKIIVGDTDENSVPFCDPNQMNLVAKVSRNDVRVYQPAPNTSKNVKIIAVDVGMKYNQIRCFTERGVELTVVPWDYDFTKEMDKYDGVFLSNGPGDPTMCKPTIENIRKALQGSKPIFGICLGHQLLSLASGAVTQKLKFGNRGHNIPCIDMRSGRCYITTQNHGYVVDVNSLTSGWQPLFINANDDTNEGIYNTEKPFFSVQFHPESTPGPRDTEYLFDVFIDMCINKLPTLPAPVSIIKTERVKVNKVLVLGSGGLSIGQAGEFDYSGSQCIKALKEEGITTVLINPNIATIQTSKGLADKVYFLPVTPEYVLKVVEHEQPDGILVTFGGQTALNCAIQIKDDLIKAGVRVLGTPIEVIMWTEDRELFAEKMAEIDEHCAISAAATTVEEAIEVAHNITGYPVICRAAFTLGGLGSGFADNDEELRALVEQALSSSPQVLIEKSMKGWKEVEYEVVRDAYDNCITVCNMENFDPLGIHTGDSIVVAPSQTLSDREFHMLRDTAIKTIRHLGVIGECNIQYALNPESEEYCIIEVNARLSRSSALASKATGYPLAFVAAKLALGIPLTEIKNQVTKVTCACFEPSLDYCIVKIPRWDLSKFSRVDNRVGSAMKSVGEVMSIGRTFEEAIQRAIRCVDDKLAGFQPQDAKLVDIEEIDNALVNATDKRLFVVATALNLGYTVERIHELTKIDLWFLQKLQRLNLYRKEMKQHTPATFTVGMLLKAKKLGFSDRQIGSFINTAELAIHQMRTENNIMPWIKQIDTVAAEFPAQTNYLYCTYNANTHDVEFNEHGVLVLGSGVYRIGSSVEFDWCAVRAVRTLRAEGIKTIMLNYNPETVSTDYDEVDRLYFGDISLETVLDIYTLETSAGVLLAMGGQVPNNIAIALHRCHVKILGTSPVNIDMAENRYKFSRMLDTLQVDQPLWKELTSMEEASGFCKRVGYPVLVRPSYVLSGAAMNVVYTEGDLAEYLSAAVEVSRENPVVISKFIENAKEIEMDAVAKDGRLVMHVISEHVENAGVHSGDATLIQPPQDLDEVTVIKIIEATAKIAEGLHVTGPMNIQFIAKDNMIKVIECNVRASRSFPFVSKTINVDLIEMATKAMTDLPFTPYPMADRPPLDFVAVKVPQFSFNRLAGADPVMGVEMASTGEIACFGRNKQEAYLKGLLAVGFKLSTDKNVLLSIGSYKEKAEFLPYAAKLAKMGYKLHASPGTADYLQEHELPCTTLDLLSFEHDEIREKDEYSIGRFLKEKMIALYVCLPSRNKYRRPTSYMSRGYKTRRMAIDFQVPLITNVKCAKLFVEALEIYPNIVSCPIGPYDSKSSYQALNLPGFVDITAQCTLCAPIDITDASAAALAGGVTVINLVPTCRDEGLPNVLEAHRMAVGNAHCDYSIMTCATSAASGIDAAGETSGVFIQAALKNGMQPHLGTLSQLESYLTTTSPQLPIIIQATGTTLASVLFLSQILDRPVHITQVGTAEDLKLVMAAKSKQFNITCDVNPLALFLTPEDFAVEKRSAVAQLVGSILDVEFMWQNLAAVDCFSVGSLAAENTSFFQAAVSLLLTAVNHGRLTLDDLVSKYSTVPKSILRIPNQVDTRIEVDLDRDWVLPASSALAGHRVRGYVARVVVRGVTVYVDGKTCSQGTGMAVKTMPYAGRPIAPVVPLQHTPVVGPTHDAFPSALFSETTPVLAATNLTPLTPMQSAVSYPEPSPMVGGRAYAPMQESPAVVPIPPTTPALTAAVQKTGLQHILSVKQFDRKQMHYIFQVAQEMSALVSRMGSVNILTGKVLIAMFYEPSTRTATSFQTAMLRLGGEVIYVNEKSSSVGKGETLKDTIRCLDCYADMIVIRHPEVGSAKEAASVSSVPIINAGDGAGEHPTQALLDVFTMREELGTINNLTITMVGDLKYGRTTHSLIQLLKHYSVTVNLVSSKCLAMPANLVNEVKAQGVTIYETDDLDSVLANTDVLYVTRVQKERFRSEAEYNEVKGKFRITTSTLLKCKEKMIVMHPLPRVDEIAPE